MKTHMKPINQGTKRSPAHLKIYKKRAKNGPPNTIPITQLLMKSVMKSLGVVLLKPCFSSRTNVL